MSYLAAVLADVWQQGVVLADFFAQLQSKLFAPWLIRWTDKTPAFALGFLFLYALAVFCFQSESANRRNLNVLVVGSSGHAKRMN